jgi:ATP-dependent HslUV protease subunit HslV
MTTIATDGKSMAGDGLCTDHTETIVDMARPKVFRLSGGRIAGGAGNSFDVDAWMAWLEAGKAGPCPIASDRFNGVILTLDGTILWVDYKGREVPSPAPVAIGSGQDFALGAMAAGASPARAVEIACARDCYSGGEITVEVL